jgi:tetratricopeptide (TPR) repeat protein
MQRLAVLYAETNQWDKSIAILKDVLEKQRKKQGPNHPDTLLFLFNLGTTYRDAGRLDEGITHLEEALTSIRKLPGPVPTNLSQVPRELLSAYAKAGEHTKMAGLLQEQLGEARKLLPKESPQLAQQLVEFSGPLLQAKAFATAEPLLRECLAIREKIQPEVWTTFNTKSSLGGALLGQKKYDEAEPLLLNGYEGMKVREKTIPPPGKTRIPEALDRLIELYTLTDKPDEGAKWRIERAKYPTPREKK